MALNFPTPATSGDVYTADNGITYTYDGVKWVGEVPSGGSLTVITPEDYEVQGVTTLAFSGAGVTVARIDDIPTVTISGGGNSNTGNVVFDGNQLYVGGTGFLNLDNSNDQAVIGTNGPSPLLVSINEGDKEWTFGTDGWLSFPGTFPSGAIGHDSDTQTLQLARSLGVSLYTQAGAWVFGSDGSITFPDDTVQTTAWTGIVANISNTAPALNNGTLWFNTEEARMYIKYNDQWVDASPTVLAPPETELDINSVTFNDATVQTTAWPGTLSYNDLTDKPVTPTFVGGGSASTWLTAD